MIYMYCSYNNIARSISILDRNAFFVFTSKFLYKSFSNLRPLDILNFNETLTNDVVKAEPYFYSASLLILNNGPLAFRI